MLSDLYSTKLLFPASYGKPPQIYHTWNNTAILKKKKKHPVHEDILLAGLFFLFLNINIGEGFPHSQRLLQGNGWRRRRKKRTIILVLCCVTTTAKISQVSSLYVYTVIRDGWGCAVKFNNLCTAVTATAGSESHGVTYEYLSITNIHAGRPGVKGTLRAYSCIVSFSE